MSYLSSRLNVMLRRLLLDYKSRNLKLEQDLIRSCRFLVYENTAFDNYDGGMDGHDIAFFLPEEVLAEIPLDKENEYRTTLSNDIGGMIPRSEKEYISEIRLLLADEGDVDFQRAKPFENKPVVNPDTLSFWAPGQIRLFISHRDAHKAGAHRLAEALKPYGISSFVAHDTIGPMKKWQREILSGLETMEVLLTYLTADFSESLWCQQEIGFALGKGIPIVSLKLEKADPPGFISDTQALKGDIEYPESSAAELYTLIARSLDAHDRLQDGLISGFVASEDFDQARGRFERMNKLVTTLTDNQIEMIVQGYGANESLYKAIYLDNHYHRLVKFMNKAAGGEWAIDGRTLKKKVAVEYSDDIPF